MEMKSIYNDFNGYNSYPINKSEEIIRNRISVLFNRVIDRNEECLIKAMNMGLEKILSRILQIKSRADRIKGDIDHNATGVYSFNPINNSDLNELHEIDTDVAEKINDTVRIYESMTCMETDMHIVKHFSEMNDLLRDIENLVHRRKDIFARNRVYG